MANQELTIPTIIQIQQLSQVLAADDNSRYTQLKSGSLIGNLSGILYLEGSLLQNMYSLNPNGASIRSVGEYVLSLCGKYKTQAQTIISNLTQAKPVITGPSNQSINVGNNAVFTISVVSSLSYTIAWYRDGILIPGQTGLTYTLSNAQLSDSGALFSAVATSAAGSTSSSQAVLTVSVALVGSYYYGDTDYTADLQSGTDDVPYLGTFPITTGQPLSITLPSGAANNKWQIFRYPTSQSIKAAWFNTALNNGAIPDAVFQSVLTIGSFYYIYSRVQLSIDTTQPMVFT